MNNMYQTAVDSQSACNLSGLANSLYEEILPQVRTEMGTDTPASELFQHPAVQLVVFQMFYLAFGGHDPLKVNIAWGDAFITCKTRALEEKGGVI